MTPLPPEAVLAFERIRLHLMRRDMWCIHFRFAAEVTARLAGSYVRLTGEGVAPLALEACRQAVRGELVQMQYLPAEMEHVAAFDDAGRDMFIVRLCAPETSKGLG